jgi:hypothetical protein
MEASPPAKGPVCQLHGGHTIEYFPGKINAPRRRIDKKRAIVYPVFLCMEKEEE